MTFTLLPTVTPWAIGFFVIAGLAVALTLGVFAESVARNRKTRLSRHQSVRTYYTARLAFQH